MQQNNITHTDPAAFLALKSLHNAPVLNIIPAATYTPPRYYAIERSDGLFYAAGDWTPHAELADIYDDYADAEIDAAVETYLTGLSCRVIDVVALPAAA